jgi:hypothetical protein
MSALPVRPDVGCARTGGRAMACPRVSLRERLVALNVQGPVWTAREPRHWCRRPGRVVIDETVAGHAIALEECTSGHAESGMRGARWKLGVPAAVVPCRCQSRFRAQSCVG